MPQAFRKRPVRFLDGIYDFVGGLKGLRFFGSDSAVQPVHDVSRTGEIASGLSQELGYFTQGVTQVHAGAGTLRTTFDPWDQVDDQGFLRAQAQVWLIHGFGRATVAANFVRSGMSVSYPTIPNAFSGQELALYEWPDAGVAIKAGVNPMTDLIRHPGFVELLPLYIPDGAVINVASQAVTDAVDIVTEGLFWAGAKGALPPGMA